jgi:hypothetical protein
MISLKIIQDTSKIKHSSPYRLFKKKGKGTERMKGKKSEEGWKDYILH